MVTSNLISYSVVRRLESTQDLNFNLDIQTALLTKNSPIFVFLHISLPKSSNKPSKSGMAEAGGRF